MKALKTAKYFFYSTILALVVGSFTSCSKDDKDDDDGDAGGVTSGWVESGNTLKYTSEMGVNPYKCTAEWTLTFNGELCTQSRMKATYSSAAIAQQVYNSIDEEDKDKASISGKVITFNYDDDHAGLSKTMLKQIIESMASM